LIRDISHHTYKQAHHYFEGAGLGIPTSFLIVSYLMKDYGIRKGDLKPCPATLPTLLQLYLASRQPLHRSAARKAKAKTAETVLVNSYATEVEIAITSITALADWYVHRQSDPKLFEYLAAFQQDLAKVRFAEDPPLPPMLKHSALSVGHHFTLINTRCLEYGERLWNTCPMLPSFLFLFCAFQGLKESKPSTVIEAVCTHLLRQGSKGVFTGGKPKRDFVKNLNIAIMDIELRRVQTSSRVHLFDP
jgi:hypothetical protein